MSEHPSDAPTTGPPEVEPIPLMQRVYDNIWLLFAASMVVVMGSYLAWGLIDLALVPPAR
jgi:hypothetical protein